MKKMQNKCEWEKSWKNNNIEVIDCKVCGFKHQYPIPSISEASDFYEKEYYEKIKPKYLSDVQNERKNRRMWAADKEKIFNSIQKKEDSKLRILDVGCSFGIFLEYFKEKGWDCIGVEPSGYAAKFAREESGIQVFEDLLENISLDKLGGKFNVVHIKEALDHLLDPLGFIKRCSKELVKPNGILCIETANQFSEMQFSITKSSGCPMWWIVPDHIGYFDRKSLTNLVNRFGFEVKHELSTFPMELFPLMGENFITNPHIGPSCHKRRLFFEDNLLDNGINDTRLHFYEILAKKGFGRGLIQISQKTK